MANRKRDGVFLLYSLLIAAGFLLICSESSPLYPINTWSDTNIFLSCGKGMLKGMVMYRDLYDHKGPLLYALYTLCALIDGAGFGGVFLLETLAVGMFLFAVYKLLSLYGVRRSAWALLPAAAAVILASESFQQGGSAEELCLPLIAWSLYAVLRWQHQRAPARMSTGSLLLHGFLCGCVLWIKFTMLGFYAVWIGGLFIYHLYRREVRAAFASVLCFLLGIALSTVPWLLYFGINGAIGDWLKTYLYDNIFLYSQKETLSLSGQLLAIVHAGWAWFLHNAAYTVPLLLGALWLTLSPKIKTADKRWMWLLFLVTALGVFIGGQDYVYYGLILAACIGCGLILPGLWMDRVLSNRGLLTLITTAVVVVCAGVYALSACGNTVNLLKPKDDTAQYRFAAVIREVPNATLLNYGFMDAGFYTAAGIAPSVKYFHQTNVPKQEMLSAQAQYVLDGATDFVVSREPLSPEMAARYALVATSPMPDWYWYDTVYLYRRSDMTTPT